MTGGRPPPSMSSSDGIPTDVIVVEGEVGDGRVPGSVCVGLLEPLRLNDDIITTWIVSQHQLRV